MSYWLEIRVAQQNFVNPALEETDAEPSFASCIRCGACAAVPVQMMLLSVDSIEKKLLMAETVTRDRIEFNPYKCDI